MNFLTRAVPCPVCRTPTAKVHGYHRRSVTDVPVDGRQVVVHLRVRRLVCPVLGCRRQTFRAHTGCRATINPPRPGGVREQTTRERRNKIHDLLGQGVGLLDCSRRLGVALNTVERYARMPEPRTLRIAPAYRPTLVDPYREHLRRRRAEEPAVPVTHLLEENRELGYTGSANLLVRYLNQGRAEGDPPLPRPAVDAGLTLPYHNGRIEGVKTRTKRIMRQMPGRAGFDLLRHRIL